MFSPRHKTFHKRRMDAHDKPQISLCVQYYSYDTKAEADAVLRFCVDHRISEIIALAYNPSAGPYKYVLGQSNLCHVTATRLDGLTPLNYLASHGKTKGIKVYAWFTYYYYTSWIGSTSYLLSPLSYSTGYEGGTVDYNASCVTTPGITNYHNPTVRAAIVAAMADFMDLNWDLAGLNLDYIRTDCCGYHQTTSADITALVGELRAAIKGREIIVTNLHKLQAITSCHQDVPTWTANDYLDGVRAMCYDYFQNKGWVEYYLDLLHPGDGRWNFNVGLSANDDSGDIYSSTCPSDNRAMFRLYADSGYKRFMLFDYGLFSDGDGHINALDELLTGRIHQTAPYPDLRSVAVVPGSSGSFTLNFGGTNYTTSVATLNAGGHNTTTAVKYYVESIEGQRPWVHYQRYEGAPTAVRIQVGDWES